MELSEQQQDMLAGKQGKATQKAIEILAALGDIYGAERLIPVSSVQIAGVSFDNLGEAGLQFLADMAGGGGKARVLATLNPAGMDVEDWEALGIDAGFAENQQRVIEAFTRMGVVATCTCTPYLSGNLPRFGEHIAWAESSAVCFANAVIGARTNREGGPSALAAALTGFTPEYGYHLEENRRPGIAVHVAAQVQGSHDFAALGKVAGERLLAAGGSVAFIRGVQNGSLEELKAFCASLATYGGAALFHMEGITPEAACYVSPAEGFAIDRLDLEQARRALCDAEPGEIDFVSLGCPHLSIREVARIAELLAGKKVTREFWITLSRPVKQIADRMGYSQAILESGAKITADTCCVVAPIRGRFKALATDSAKACYYAAARHHFKTALMPFDDVVRQALR